MFATDNEKLRFNNYLRIIYINKVEQDIKGKIADTVIFYKLV